MEIQAPWYMPWSQGRTSHLGSILAPQNPDPNIATSFALRHCAIRGTGTLGSELDYVLAPLKLRAIIGWEYACFFPNG